MKQHLMRHLFPFCLSLIVLAACQPEDRNGSDLPLRQQLDDTPHSGFAQATKPRPLLFPQDHGAHPEFKNEWWYFTGNLQSPQGKRFGYQVTFFRSALTPEPAQRSSNWATNQAWMAHAALTDVASQIHLKSERFARGALDLAGASTTPFKVWLDNWQVTGSDAGFPWQIKLESPDFSLTLNLQPAKAIVLNGNQGLSQKSPQPGNASHYYSITRLHSSGQLTVKGDTHAVSGFSWLDREWGSSLLDEQQSGWDWFALQLDEGSELMFYQLRYQDGRPHPNSLGTWVDKNSRYQVITPEQIKLTPLSWWQSAHGSRYPIAWQLDYLPLNKSWRVEAVLADQLMDLSVTYWEGAVNIYDTASGSPVGRGYLEMTGY